MPSHRAGLLAGIGAYLIWGLIPLFWPLLEPAAPVEILGHRVVWSLLFLIALLAVTTGFRWVRTLGWRRVGLLGLAAVLVTVNWGMFIYAVNSDQVVEVSLGYFINPLVTVALAVGLLGERLGRRQVIAFGIAAAGVAVLALDYGRLPWIALTLAFSFGAYGLVKKRAGVDGTQSLAVETTLLVAPAIAYLLWLQASGDSTLATEGGGHLALLAAGGVATAVPLILFGAAAIRIPLATRAAAVHRPGDAVRNRRPHQRRAHARVAARRLHPGLDRAGGVRLRRRARRADERADGARESGRARLHHRLS